MRTRCSQRGSAGRERSLRRAARRCACQYRLEQQKHRARGPRLRFAGDGYAVGPSPAAAKTRRTARQPLHCRHTSSSRQAREDFQRQVGESASRQACRDDGVVVRPDGSIVIRHRVVAPLERTGRANAPARKHVIAEQAFRHAPAVPLARCRQQAWPGFEVRTRQGCLRPSRASAYPLMSCTEIFRTHLQAFGARGQLVAAVTQPKRRRDVCRLPICRVHVALHFA